MKVCHFFILKIRAERTCTAVLTDLFAFCNGTAYHPCVRLIIPKPAIQGSVRCIKNSSKFNMTFDIMHAFPQVHFTMKLILQQKALLLDSLIASSYSNNYIIYIFIINKS